MRTLSLLVIASASTPAMAQIASEDFSSGNTHEWGVEFGAPAPHDAAGGNPGGRIEVTVQNSTSMLPAAMIVPRLAGHPWSGDFRSLGVSEFRFDRQVEAGSSNFGTRPFLVLGNDGGTSTDFLDDSWAFVETGDDFQFGFVPWATIATPIPATSVLKPANWDVAALPSSPWSGLGDDVLWDSILRDVDYVGIAMDRPLNGGFWFGGHVLSLDNLVLDAGGGLGAPYCTANPNSTGSAGNIGAVGSSSVAVNDVTLQATELPLNAFGYFLTSQQQAFVTNPGGSEGNLCLGGAIGRFVGPGQIQNTGSTGSFVLAIDLATTPSPTGPVSVAPGETWYYQAWHRDAQGGAATSNLTNGLEIAYQ